MHRPLALSCLIVVLVISFVLPLTGKREDPFRDLDRTVITAEGRVRAKEIRTAASGRTLWVTLGPARAEGREAGRILCGMPLPENGDEVLPIGALLRVRGRVSCFREATNHGEFDALAYYSALGLSFRMRDCVVLASDGRRSLLPDLAFRLKRALEAVADRVFEGTDAGTMKAVLLGDKGDLDQERKALFRSQSINHLLVVSGLHISFIGMGIYRFLRKRTREREACLASLTAVVFYGLMTGFGVSSRRAVLMFAVYILSKLAGRTYDMLTALGVSAAVQALTDPGSLRNSAFFFSFGCVLAIGVLMPALDGKLLKAAAVPAALLPVYLRTFYTFPMLSAAVNLLVLPLSGVLILGGFLALAAGAVWDRAGMAAGRIPHFILRFYDQLCSLAGRIPGNTAILGAKPLWLLALYLFGLILLVCLGKRLPRLLKVILLSGAMMLFSSFSEGELVMHFIDVGQGDGILICRGDKAVMIDGGSSDREDTWTWQILPLLRYYGISSVDCWIITHGDADHMNGMLRLMEDRDVPVRVGRLLLPEIDERCPAATDLLREAESAAAARGIPVDYLSAGDVIRYRDLTLTCLHPRKQGFYEDANDSSIVLLVGCGRFTALLAGDLEEGKGGSEFLSYAGADARPLTVFKCAHHGSRNGTWEDLLCAFPPEYAVISCGTDNSYGHPHEETLRLIREAGAKVLDTRFLGEITVRTDGVRTKITGFMEDVN